MGYLLPFALFSDLSHMLQTFTFTPIAMQVSLKVQLNALGFCKSGNPPEVLMKIMLDTAVDAFAKCTVSVNVQMMIL